MHTSHFPCLHVHVHLFLASMRLVLIDGSTIIERNCVHLDPIVHCTAEIECIHGNHPNRAIWGTPIPCYA